MQRITSDIRTLNRRRFAFVLGAVAPLLGAEKAGKPVTFGMKYEGGSLPLDLHDGLKVELAKEAITVVQSKNRIPIAVASITEISYGNDVHRRVGAAIGVGIVTLGIGALLALTKTKKH